MHYSVCPLENYYYYYYYCYFFAINFVGLSKQIILNLY